MNPYVIEQFSRLMHALLRTAPTASPHASERANVLVIKPASLGDVLMSTAFLAALRANLPHASITVLVTAWAKVALAGNPHCDRILDAGSVGFPGRYGIGAYRECLSRLRNEVFTHCFVLDRSPLMALLPRLAGIPWRAGLDSAGRGIALHVGVPCPADCHEVEIYLEVLRAVGYGVRVPRLHFCPDAAADAAASKLLAEIDLENAGPLIALHPGGGQNPGQDQVSKRWSSGNFQSLADRLTHTRGARILLVGGPDDKPVTVKVRSGSSTHFVDVAGRLTFPQLGALLKRCHLFIGNDSAPMHLAAAVGTPVVALFGPTSPQRYGPYGMRNATVQFDPRQGAALNKREVEAVATAADRVLNQDFRSE